jgi:tripartite-type tricarboxylate transporter receptor subunit TctC
VPQHEVPAPVIELLHENINAVLGLPDVQKLLTRQGLDVEVMTRQQFADFLAEDAKRWRDLVQVAHLVF